MVCCAIPGPHPQPLSYKERGARAVARLHCLPYSGEGIAVSLYGLLGCRRGGGRLGRQILVFHFPCVIQCVKRGVPNQIPERPVAGHFTLSMKRPNGGAVSVAVRS